MSGAAGTPRSGLRPFAPVPFGRFTLLAPLAAGGMGEIFLARSTFQGGLDKLCVIKKVLPELSQDPEFVERFHDEARTLVQLQHGSIAQVYDTGSFDGEHWIAMEFVDGKDLRRLLQRAHSSRSKLPAVLALFVMSKVLEALGYAHRKKDERGNELGLVHRDVSPQNILVSYDGEVKVIDFGLARSKLTLGRNQPQAVLGKLYYMPPEQARGEAVDRRSDLYAVGIVLYELLTGRNPFEDAEQDELFHRVCNPVVPAIDPVASSLPPSVCDAVAQAIAPDPEARFQTAEQLRTRLSSALAELAPGVGPEQLASYLGTLFSEEHRREREVIARFALKTEADGAPFGPLTHDPHHVTRRVQRSRSPSGRGEGAWDRLSDAVDLPTRAGADSPARLAAHLSAATVRFDPRTTSSPARAGESEAPSQELPSDTSADAGEARKDRGPSHLMAPTLRGSGLVEGAGHADLPWDRRGSGTRALVSAAAAVHSGPRSLPWDGPDLSEADSVATLAEEPPPAAHPAAAVSSATPSATPSAAPSAAPSATPAAAPSAAPSAAASRQEPESEATTRRRRLTMKIGAMAILVAVAGVAIWTRMDPIGAADLDQGENLLEEIAQPVNTHKAPDSITESTTGASTDPASDPADAQDPAPEEPSNLVPEAQPVEAPAQPPEPAQASPPPRAAAAPAAAKAAPPTAPTRAAAEPRSPLQTRAALERRHGALLAAYRSLVAAHGSDRLGSIVVGLMRAFDTNFQRFIDTPDRYDSLESQLAELEEILDERRVALQ